MSVRTKAADKIGTTTHQARVVIHVELDDPEAYGNLGLEGRDEFFESTDVDDVDAGKAWIEAFRAAQGEIVSGDVVSHLWEKSTYADAEFGFVVDAEPRTVGEWYGSPQADGSWHWEVA